VSEAVLEENRLQGGRELIENTGLGGTYSYMGVAAPIWDPQVSSRTHPVLSGTSPDSIWDPIYTYHLSFSNTLSSGEHFGTERHT
jgi:hypothetical protein